MVFCVLAAPGLVVVWGAIWLKSPNCSWFSLSADGKTGWETNRLLPSTSNFRHLHANCIPVCRSIPWQCYLLIKAFSLAGLWICAQEEACVFVRSHFCLHVWNEAKTADGHVSEQSKFVVCFCFWHATCVEKNGPVQSLSHCLSLRKLSSPDAERLTQTKMSVLIYL